MEQKIEHIFAKLMGQILKSRVVSYFQSVGNTMLLRKECHEYGGPPHKDYKYLSNYLCFRYSCGGLPRLLRDSHLDLEIESLKGNSFLILDRDSQFCCENSHSQISCENSREFEKSRLNLVGFSGKLITFHTFQNCNNISLQF